METAPPRRLLLGPGRLPEPLRSQLLADDVLTLEEGLFGSVTYRRYRASGQRIGVAKQAVSAAIAVTASPLVVWASGMTHIDLPRGASAAHGDRRHDGDTGAGASHL